MAHEAISVYALRLGQFDLPCATIAVTRDGPDDRWTVRALDVPTDALRALRGAIGPGVGRFALEITDYAGKVHRTTGHIPRAPGELGYELLADTLTFEFEGHID